MDRPSQSNVQIPTQHIKKKLVDSQRTLYPCYVYYCRRKDAALFYESALCAILTIDDMAKEQKNGLNALRPIVLGNFYCTGAQFRCEKTTFLGHARMNT